MAERGYGRLRWEWSEGRVESIVVDLPPIHSPRACLLPLPQSTTIGRERLDYEDRSIWVFGIDHLVTAQSGQCFVTVLQTDKIWYDRGSFHRSTAITKSCTVCRCLHSLVMTKVHRLRQPGLYDRSPWYPGTVPNFIILFFNNRSIWIGVIQPLLALRDRWLRHPCVCTLFDNGWKPMRIEDKLLSL